MSDTYYFILLLVTNLLPELLMTLMFVGVIVGLFIRGIRSIT